MTSKAYRQHVSLWSAIGAAWITAFHVRRPLHLWWARLCGFAAQWLPTKANTGGLGEMLERNNSVCKTDYPIIYIYIKKETNDEIWCWWDVIFCWKTTNKKDVYCSSIMPYLLIVLDGDETYVIVILILNTRISKNKISILLQLKSWNHQKTSTSFLSSKEL